MTFLLSSPNTLAPVLAEYAEYALLAVLFHPTSSLAVPETIICGGTLARESGRICCMH